MFAQPDAACPARSGSCCRKEAGESVTAALPGPACMGTATSLTPYLASRARAMIPAARGAEADVPVWDSVHFCHRSVVTWRTEKGRPAHSQLIWLPFTCQLSIPPTPGTFERK